MKRCLGFVLCILFSLNLTAQAEPPPVFDYQGKILVGDIPLTGSGYFKYAISSEDGTTNFWSHDGTTVGEPATYVTNDCFNGVFSTSLGTLPMTAINPNIFGIETALFLRVWFSSDEVTFDEMLPAQELLSVPYAIHADMLDGYHADELIAAATNAFTESDPVWNAEKAGYATGMPLYAYTETDPVWAAEKAGYATGTPLYAYTETDPVWNAEKAGYATGTPLYVFTETDPVWTAASNGIQTQISNLETAKVSKAGDTMTGILGINVGLDNDLVITNSGDTIRIGRQTSATNAGIAIGPQSYANNRAVAIGGRLAFADDQGVAVGYGANAFDHGVAVGYDSQGYVSGAGVGALSEGDNQGAALGYGATGSERGAAVGYFADGREDGVAVGYQANGSYTGIAVGVSAEGDGMGIAVGYQANGRGSGVAAGNNATGFEYGIGIGESAYGRASGVAIGLQASGYSNAVAVGNQANADHSGVAVGSHANGARTNIAIGVAATAAGGSERIAIGHDVNNTVDESMRIRGEFYMDGGGAIYGRTSFGAGPFQRLLPLIPMDNVVYVSANGTAAGTGAIDQPFDTPQRGYDHAAAKYTNVPATLVIASGQYPGLNMHAGNIHVAGLDRAQIAVLEITAPAHSILGKQRVHNLIVAMATTVAADGGEDVKFHNCRFDGGLYIYGPKVEVQDCYAANLDGTAVTIGVGFSPIESIALYNSSFFNLAPMTPTLVVEVGVNQFEVIGCQIVNGLSGPCIEDRETGPIVPVHLYAHNYIRGATPGPGTTAAVQDPAAGGAGPTIAFLQNSVMGHVGLNGNPQFYANNIVYGLINNTGGPGFPGWMQAGAGAGTDTSGNTEHEIMTPPLPASWRD